MYYVSDLQIVLGCAPMFYLGHPKAMYDMHIRGVVNMCSEYSGPESAYKELGIKQLRLPSVDHYEPDFRYMQDAVKFIEEHKKRNEKVYIHCKAGHGRAASIALCWLIHIHRDRTAEVSDEDDDDVIVVVVPPSSCHRHLILIIDFCFLNYRN